MLALIVTIASACVAPRTGASQECIFNDDCPSGQLCAGTLCRAICRDDRDCSGGFLCRPSATPTKRACLPPDDFGYCVHSSDCGPPWLCSLGRCVPQARAPEDCATYDVRLRPVSTAMGIVCLWPEDQPGDSDASR